MDNYQENASIEGETNDFQIPISFVQIGLQKRELIAIAVFQGLLANSAINEFMDDDLYRCIATDAVKCADYFLAALGKSEGTNE